MNEQIKNAYKENVELKYQLYNSLFLTLPFDHIKQTGHLLPLLQNACATGYDNGYSPINIIHKFFEEHKPGISEQDQVSFLFNVIQYIERQIVLIDSLEEAHYEKIHRTAESNAWYKIKEKAQNRGLEKQLHEVLSSIGIRIVLTAHPTQFYPGKVLAISSDLREAIKNNDISLAQDYIRQLGKTPFYRKQKPGAYDEALSLTWYLGNVFYPSAGEIVDNLHQTFDLSNDKDYKLINLGFWPGGDRDGNPFVTTEITKKVARELRYAILNCYYSDIKILKRRLSFKGVFEELNALEKTFYNEITQSDQGNFISIDDLLEVLEKIEKVILEQHQGLFLEKLRSFKRKVQLFGYYFASLDIRQDSRIIKKSFNALLSKYPEAFPKDFNEMDEKDQVASLFSINKKIEYTEFDDAVVQDTLNSFGVIRDIQKSNGECGAHRYIISNCKTVTDIARVVALARLCGWGDDQLTLDIVPLFETIDDLKNAGESMTNLFENPDYKKHLSNRNDKQTVMLGYSDGTKDGGYLMANWSIFKAKEDITKVSRNYDVSVLFFDGRGGPPSRGGGNTHMFYAAMGKTIESKQIQLTLQGQTISSHYGMKMSAVHNLGYLLSAGIENNLFKRAAANLSEEQWNLIDQVAESGYKKYLDLKNHPKFLSFLVERSTLKYYGMTNIGSRPTKRGKTDEIKFEDLRAIPFVGAWSQLKQNVPGYFGLGSALKEQEEKGRLNDYIELYQSSMLFKAMISNSMQSMSKTNFAITSYMQNDAQYGAFWKIIYDEFQLSKEMALKVSGYQKLLEDNPRSSMSIKLREKTVLPLLTIQQYALMEIQKLKEEGNMELLPAYEKMVIRSLFGNINASRNSV